MEISKAIEIASLLAKGINPNTRKPFDDGKARDKAHNNTNKVNQQAKYSPPPQNISAEQAPLLSPQMLLQNPAARKHMHQVSEALVRLMADVHHGSQFEVLDDYLARRRKECMPSLRMIGIDDDNGWALIKAHWTIQYWQERAVRAELLLNAK